MNGHHFLADGAIDQNFQNKRKCSRIDTLIGTEMDKDRLFLVCECFLLLFFFLFITLIQEDFSYAGEANSNGNKKH